MSDTSLAIRLIETLPAGVPGLYNPWRDQCLYDTAANGPLEKRDRLDRHLDCDPVLILVGEAPGYQGCRYSGIAFTSERLLMEGEIPRIAPLAQRLTTRRLPFSEPSATIVWKTLYRLGIAERTILWNALQLHPYRPGEPWTNRTPTPNELLLGAPALQLLMKTFPSARCVAVGKKAEQLMTAMHVRPSATVRHPANGGATAFATGIDELMNARPVERYR